MGGSGLILFFIVLAWFVVLVPMVWRSTDVSGSLKGVDTFSDAMRVLSRRSAPGAGAVDEPADDPVEQPVATEPVRTPSSQARRTAAARRRRVLLVLLGLAVVTLAGALLGPTWLWAPHVVVDLLLVAFVVHLRRAALRRAERSRTAPRVRRAEPAPVVVAEPATVRTVRLPAHVAGIPDRMPPRPAPLEVPLAPTADQVPARGAQGDAWSPVPVPTPTYLSAPVAPRRRVDLTRPGAYSDGLADAERELGIVDEGPQLDEILDRRRAVNDW